MGWPPRPAQIDAVRQYAVGVANAILQGETSAYEGAKLLWLMSIELGLMEEALRTFAGLASEWEDAPERRDEYEREIVVAADRIRAHFGP